MGAGSQPSLNLNVNCNWVDKLFPFSKVVSLERWKMSWILYCSVFRAIDLSGSKFPAVVRRIFCSTRFLLARGWAKKEIQKGPEKINYLFGHLLLAIDNGYQYSLNQQNKACCGRRAKFLFIYLLLSWLRKPVAAPPRNWLSLFLIL